MKVKLTLTIEDHIKERAKALATAKHTSVSAMVEKYFESIDADMPEDPQIDPRVKELIGIAADRDVNADKVLLETMMEKHVHD